MGLTILPQAGNKLGQTRDAIRHNFEFINNDYQVDHIQLHDATVANRGFHKKITFYNHGNNDPEPAIYANGITMYRANSALRTGTGGGSVQSQIYLLRGNTVVNRIPFAASRFNAASEEGWSYLPSGILIKWGRRANVGDGERQIIFPAHATEIPVFTEIFSINVTPFGANAVDEFVQVGNILADNAGFTVFCTRRTTNNAHQANFYYFVIGI